MLISPKLSNLGNPSILGPRIDRSCASGAWGIYAVPGPVCFSATYPMPVPCSFAYQEMCCILDRSSLEKGSCALPIWCSPCWVGRLYLFGTGSPVLGLLPCPILSCMACVGDICRLASCQAVLLSRSCRSFLLS